MKKSYFFVFLVICVSLGLGGCKSHPSRNTNYVFSLKDSLYWEKHTVDTIVKIPYSIVNMIIDPSKMEEGERKESSKGQANISIEKKGDSLVIEASCDSLELVVYSLQERLIKITDQNEQLQEQVKAAPSKTKWFCIGMLSALGILVVIYIGILFLKRKT